ncbi:MAG: OsmC family protein [Anaerolineae bacterium]
MAIRKASAVWEGSLREGKGTMRLGSGAFEGAYSFSTRFEDAPGTNPEELIGAAHAGCFSMAFSGNLGRAGFTPDYVRTTADVHLEKVETGFKITRIVLHLEAKVPGLDEKTFREQAEAAKSGCPVSQALAAVPIELDARLVS